MALAGYLDGEIPVEAALTEFGKALARHLLCDNAVAINRCAISEARSGPSLAGRLSRLGRDPIRRLFVEYLERCHTRGLLHVEDPHEAVHTFVGLLLGDTQTERLLGIAEAPDDEDVEGRATRAVQRFLRLYGPSG